MNKRCHCDLASSGTATCGAPRPVKRDRWKMIL